MNSIAERFQKYSAEAKATRCSAKRVNAFCPRFRGVGSIDQKRQLPACCLKTEILTEKRDPVILAAVTTIQGLGDNLFSRLIFHGSTTEIAFPTYSTVLSGLPTSAVAAPCPADTQTMLI
jgi:hypothetical protein